MCINLCLSYLHFPGLEPAHPGFSYANIANRLTKEDAEFVDVVHTNSGSVWEVILTSMGENG